MAETRSILIGGTSHTGKSTLARHLAQRLGGTSRSTDRLARHPGRPWAPAPFAVPPHVVAHYRDLTDDERMTSVLTHYRGMRPLIEEVVRGRDPSASLVLEGSALLPETIEALQTPDIAAVWLVADDDLLHHRIEAESGYAAADAGSRRLIDAFAQRACRFDRFIREQLHGRASPAVFVRDGVGVEALGEECLQMIGNARRG